MKEVVVGLPRPWVPMVNRLARRLEQVLSLKSAFYLNGVNLKKLEFQEADLTHHHINYSDLWSRQSSEQYCYIPMQEKLIVKALPPDFR